MPVRPAYEAPAPRHPLFAAPLAHVQEVEGLRQATLAAQQGLHDPRDHPAQGGGNGPGGGGDGPAAPGPVAPAPAAAPAPPAAPPAVQAGGRGRGGGRGGRGGGRGGGRDGGRGGRGGGRELVQQRLAFPTAPASPTRQVVREVTDVLASPGSAEGLLDHLSHLETRGSKRLERLVSAARDAVVSSANCLVVYCFGLGHV